MATDGIDAELPHVRDRRRGGEVRRWIAGPRHVELGVEAAVETPGDHRRMKRLLPRRRSPEDPAAPRHPEPFVKIPHVPVDAE